MGTPLPSLMFLTRKHIFQNVFANLVFNLELLLSLDYLVCTSSL